MAVLFNSASPSRDEINKNIFGAKRTAIYDQSDDLLVLFDAVLTAGHVYETKVSNHPSEDGTQFSDMQVANPRVLNLSVIISNHPSQSIDSIDIGQFATGIGTGLVANISKSVDLDIPLLTPLLTQNRLAALGTSLAVVSQFLDPETIRNDIVAFEALRKMQLHSTRAVIVTPFESYNNMLLKSMNITKDKDSTTSLRANLVFQEVLIYHTESSLVEPKATTDVLDDEAANVEEQGAKQSPPTDEVVATQTNKTAGAALFDLFSR